MIKPNKKSEVACRPACIAIIFFFPLILVKILLVAGNPISQIIDGVFHVNLETFFLTIITLILSPFVKPVNGTIGYETINHFVPWMLIIFYGACAILIYWLQKKYEFLNRAWFIICGFGLTWLLIFSVRGFF
jgi:hypothetical protein